eukprot:6918835-Ditylum_brightwellii.AAC.1
MEHIVLTHFSQTEIVTMPQAWEFCAKALHIEHKQLCCDEALHVWMPTAWNSCLRNNKTPEMLLHHTD